VNLLLLLVAVIPAVDSRPLATADAVKIVAVVCPTQNSKKGCSVCPDGHAASWSFDSISRGHFLRPDSDDILVGTGGCEPHANNFGGSVLLTNKNGQLQKVWYQGGLISNHCRKVALRGGRDILLCEDTWSGQGEEDLNIYSVDLTAPEDKRMNTLLRASDTLRACYAGGQMRRAYVERVELPDLDNDGLPDLRVTVQLGFTAKITQRQFERFCAGPNPKGPPAPPTRPHHFEFLLKPNGYALAPSSESPDLLEAEKP